MARPRKYKEWTELDNAAKIFPCTCDKRDPKVFRFVCELKEAVQPAVLQEALDRTLQDYRGYLTVMKHGFFWYYLEATDLRPEVHVENTQICSPLYDKNESSLLFDVSYFSSRINFEIFHALTDGTGALEFLRQLTCSYLALAYPEVLKDVPKFSGCGASVTEKMEDSFQKYYDPKRKKGTKKIFAYRVKGARLPENLVKVVEGVMPVDKLLALAREHNTTMTILLTAVFILAIHENRSVRERKKPISISVPVNLRKYFASDSARNFFSVIHIFYTFKEGKTELTEVIASVSEQLKKHLTVEKLSETINSYVSIEKNAAIRVVPLAIKDFVMRQAYKWNELSVTGSFSNIGVVKLPPEYAKYVNMIDVMTSTKKLQVCMGSFENNLVVNFTDSFVSTDIQKYFFRMLSKMGIPIEIISNPLFEEGGRKL